MSFVAAFSKAASFGDTHRDGTSFNQTGGEPHTYGGGPGRANPSANPSFDPSGSKDRQSDKKKALNIVLGLNKMSALRDDIARGVSEGLEKEYNGTDPARNLDDLAAQKEAYKKHLRIKNVRKGI